MERGEAVLELLPGKATAVYLARCFGVRAATVGRAAGNAVAERFIQRLKVEFTWERDWQNLEDLPKAVKGSCRCTPTFALTGRSIG